MSNVATRPSLSCTPSRAIIVNNPGRSTSTVRSWRDFRHMGSPVRTGERIVWSEDVQAEMRRREWRAYYLGILTAVVVTGFGALLAVNL